MAAMNPRVRAALDQLYLGQAARARQMLTPILAAEPDNVDALIAAAESARRDGDLAAAGSAIRAALLLDPENQWGLRVSAFTWAGYHHHEAAAAMALRAVGLGPRVAENHRTLAVILRMAGRGQDALAAADRAVELAPDEADMHAARAGVLRVLRRTEEADAAYQTVLRLDPQRAGALHDLAVTRLESGRFGVRRLEGIVRGLISAAAMDTSLGDVVRRNVVVAMAAGLQRLRRLMVVVAGAMLVLWLLSVSQGAGAPMAPAGNPGVSRAVGTARDGPVAGVGVVRPVTASPDPGPVPVLRTRERGVDNFPAAARWLGLIGLLGVLGASGWWVLRMTRGGGARAALAIVRRDRAVWWPVAWFVAGLALVGLGAATGAIAWVVGYLGLCSAGWYVRGVVGRRVLR
jgi:hypothetical protein